MRKIRAAAGVDAGAATEFPSHSFIFERTFRSFYLEEGRIN